MMPMLRRCVNQMILMTLQCICNSFESHVISKNIECRILGLNESKNYLLWTRRSQDYWISPRKQDTQATEPIRECTPVVSFACIINESPDSKV